MKKHVWIAIFLLVPGWALGQTTALPEGPPVFPNFGAVGVSSNDKVRLNLVHVLAPEGPPQLPCMVQASLFQAQTTPPCFDCLPPAPLAQNTLTLDPGKSGALEFTPSLAMGARQSLRAVLIPEGPPNRCRNVVATLEVFDVVTGRLSLLYGGLPEGPPGFPQAVPDGPPNIPQAGRIAGLLGITGNDTVRLNLVNVLAPDGPPGVPQACMVQASFVGPAVDLLPPVLALTTLALMPGQAAVLDYSPTLGDGVRKSLRAVLLPDGPPVRCQNVVTTLEVFDRTAGRTFVLAPEGPPSRR